MPLRYYAVIFCHYAIIATFFMSCFADDELMLFAISFFFSLRHYFLSMLPDAADAAAADMPLRFDDALRAYFRHCHVF